MTQNASSVRWKTWAKNKLTSMAVDPLTKPCEKPFSQSFLAMSWTQIKIAHRRPMGEAGIQDFYRLRAHENITKTPTCITNGSREFHNRLPEQHATGPGPPCKCKCFDPRDKTDFCNETKLKDRSLKPVRGHWDKMHGHSRSLGTSPGTCFKTKAEKACAKHDSEHWREGSTVHGTGPRKMYHG